MISVLLERHQIIVENKSKQIKMKKTVLNIILISFLLNLNAQDVLNINDRNITLQEFKSIFYKNNQNVEINKEYLEEISLKRSLNFEFLTGRLRKLYTDLAFEKLPIGCVPQFYILRDDSGTFVKKLKTDLMAINNWPGEELPLAVKDSPERYPIANKLSRTLLLLPIHQSTTQDQLDQIV